MAQRPETDTRTTQRGPVHRPVPGADGVDVRRVRGANNGGQAAVSAMQHTRGLVHVVWRSMLLRVSDPSLSCSHDQSDDGRDRNAATIADTGARRPSRSQRAGWMRWKRRRSITSATSPSPEGSIHPRLLLLFRPCQRRDQNLTPISHLSFPVFCCLSTKPIFLSPSAVLSFSPLATPSCWRDGDREEG